jgi:hypothetical protein
VTISPPTSSSPYTAAAVGVTSLSPTPSNEWRYAPSAIKSGITRFESAAEIPNPMFSPPAELATAATTPSAVTIGPPLLPGLSAASVWTASGIEKLLGAGSSRSTPLTIPREADPPRSNGVPIAITSVPTGGSGDVSANESVRASVGRSAGRRTARSE